MPRTSSAAIDRVDYTPAKQILDVWYRGGACYSYLGVPAEAYEALLDAPSVGGFVNAHIKPWYPCRRQPGWSRIEAA